MEALSGEAHPAASAEAMGLALGERLRRLRRAHGLSLRQLAQAVGTSASFLSQLERGLTGASTSTLMRIAACFQTSLSELFDGTGGPRHPVMRRQDRPMLQMLGGQRKTLLSRRPLTQFEVYVAEFDPDGSTGADPYTHGDAHEMFLVLAGRVRIELGPECHELGPGDCIEYATSTPHRVANVGGERAEVLFIISPPTSTAESLAELRQEPVASGRQDAAARRAGSKSDKGREP